MLETEISTAKYCQKRNTSIINFNDHLMFFMSSLLTLCRTSLYLGTEVQKFSLCSLSGRELSSLLDTLPERRDSS